MKHIKTYKPLLQFFKMVGCQYSRTIGLHEQMYRGIFASPLDFDLAEIYARMADLKEKYGLQPSETQINARERIRKLEELGGIQKPIDMAIAEKELQEFLDSKN